MLIAHGSSRLPAFVVVLVTLFGCREDVERQVDTKNANYEHRLGALEDRSDVLGMEQSDQREDIYVTRLKYDENMATVSSCQSYLSRLDKRLNEMRPQDLPEWQEMYDALTSPKAAHDPDFGLGKQHLPVHFFAQERRLDHIESQEQSREALVKVHQQTIEQHEKLLAQVSANMNGINELIVQQQSDFDRRLDGMANQLVSMQNFLNTMDAGLKNVQGVTKRLEGRLQVLEQLLRTYDIATMDRRLGDAETAIVGLETRTGQVEGRLTVAEGDIQNLDQEVIDIEIQLSKTNTDVSALDQRVAQVESKIP